MSFMLRTFSGHVFDIEDPKPIDIQLNDIIAGLCRQVRFNGHTHRPYTVAQHSYLASYAPEVRGSRELQRLALMHDAAEAYLGDVITPLKRLMRGGYEELEARYHDAISEALNIDLRSVSLDVQRVDWRMLCTEYSQLLNGEGLDRPLHYKKPEPYEQLIIDPWEPQVDFYLPFVRRVGELFVTSRPWRTQPDPFGGPDPETPEN